MSGLLQVNNYNRWLQMEKGGGLPLKITVVIFIWRTTVMSYRPRAAVVGLKWNTLVVVGLALNKKRWWLSTENDSGELQMKNYGIRL